MKRDEPEMEDDLRTEYDLKHLRVRKLGSGRKSFGGVTVRLEPDVAEMFPSADAVNEALPNGQMVTLGDTFTTTVFITEIVIIALFVHDATDVAPIVYDVVTDGVHMTLAAVFVFK